MSCRFIPPFSTESIRALYLTFGGLLPHIKLVMIFWYCSTYWLGIWITLLKYKSCGTMSVLMTLIFPISVNFLNAHSLSKSSIFCILASRFLQRFVKNDIPWVHMDLSSSIKKGGLAHIPTDTIGFGVRYSVNLLLNNYLK